VPADDLDVTAVDHLLMTTRAVRRRLDLDRPVDPDLVVECLRLAIQAPTGSNAQGWRWVVVTDAGKRAALAELYRRAGADYLEQGRVTAEESGDPVTARVYDSAAYLRDRLEDVPVHVIPCILGRLGDSTPTVWSASFYGSIFPAVWSFQLALRSRGLGSCLTTLHLGFEAEAADVLGIPETVTQVGLIPVAHYTGETFQPAQRRPVEEITYWDGWKQSRQG
jgi:nitroreductase